MQDERGYVVAAKSGDRDAFDLLLREHLPALRARVRGALRHRPDIDADEIVQQTMVRSFQAFDVFDERYAFGQYLFGIAKYILRRHLCATAREVAIAWDETPANEGSPCLWEVESLPDGARALAGVDRFARPDRHAVDRTRLCELLEAVMLHGGYPHQQIAFAYGTVLWGKRNVVRNESSVALAGRSRPDKKPITSDPDRVMRELSGTPLAVAGDELRREIAASERLAPTDLGPAFHPFESRARLRVGELFTLDPVSRRRFEGLRDRIVGATTLSDYYGEDPRKSIADWIAAVKKRTEKYFSGRLDLTKTTLPMPGGHDNSGGGRLIRRDGNGDRGAVGGPEAPRAEEARDHG